MKYLLLVLACFCLVNAEIKESLTVKQIAENVKNKTDFLNLFFDFSIGYTPKNKDMLVYNDRFNYSCPTPMFTDIEFNIRAIGMLYVGGGIRTVISPINIMSYSPISEVYLIGCGYNIAINNKFAINSYYIHECQHIVAAIKMRLPVHEDRFKDEMYINFVYNHSLNSKIFAGLGYITSNSQSINGCSDSALINRDNYSSIKNMSMIFLSLEGYYNYKGFYCDLYTKIVPDFNYCFSEEIGYKFNINRISLGIGIKNTNEKQKSLDYNSYKDKASLRSRDKVEIFIKLFGKI